MSWYHWVKRISRGKKTFSKTFPLHFTVPWSYILKKSYNNDQSKAIASDTDLAIRCTHTDSQSSRVWFPGNCNISSMIFNSIVWSPISNYQYSWLKWKQYGAEEKTCKTFILSYLAQRQNESIREQLRININSEWYCLVFQDPSSHYGWVLHMGRITEAYRGLPTHTQAQLAYK